MSSFNTDLIKLRIKERYDRLRKGERRPSFEYISPRDIKDIFIPYSTEPEKIENLTDEETLLFYTAWYKKNVTDAEINELHLPTID